jgi:Fe-S cluster assembly protein SufD
VTGGPHFVGAYKAFAANGASGAPPWLKEMRERAIARFAEVGFPTTRLEQWRFTSVEPISETPFELQRASWELGPVPAGVTVSRPIRSPRCRRRFSPMES